MLIINVTPKKHLLSRIALNWHNFIVNHLMAAHLANSILVKLVSAIPTGAKYLDHYLDGVVDKVEEQIKKKHDVQPHQIHFRGLERLSTQQQELFYSKLTERLDYDFRQNKKYLYFYTLQTTDNARLDSVEIRPKETEKDITNRRFIICCMPQRSNFVDLLKQYTVYAQELNATIIAFNYRGVGLSEGLVTNEQSLYSDAYEQAQRLIALGVPPEQIGLLGECLGGNIATHTAGTLHEEGLPVKLFNARSFRSSISLLEGHSAPPEKEAPVWYPSTWWSWLKYTLVYSILTPIIWSTGWSLNVEDKFTAIPPHDRDYLVVRSNKDEHGKRFADDLMVPHKQASTYSLVKKQINAINKKRNEGKPLSEVEEEWLSDVPKNHKFYVSEALYAGAREANGHVTLPRVLVTTKVSDTNPSIDGRQYTLNFFKRVWSNNEHQTRCEKEEVNRTGVELMV